MLNYSVLLNLLYQKNFKIARSNFYVDYHIYEATTHSFVGKESQL